MNSNQQQPQEPTTSSSQPTTQLPPVDFGNQLKLTLLDEHHQVDVHATSITTSDNFWKEQSDEEFLKTLFENTLLSDHDFSKKATDFADLGLGFDNLQLNYDATGVSEDDQTTHHTSLSTLLSNINTTTATNSTNTSHAPPGRNDDHLITSLNDALSTSKLAAVENDHNHDVLTTIMTNENPLLVPSNHPPADDQQQQQRQNPPNTSSAAASADSPSFVIIENLITTSDLLIKNVDCNNRENDDDDKIFKRPSNDFLKFSLPSETTATTTDNYTGDMSVKQMKMLRLKKAEELCKRDELKAAKLKENNKLTGKQQQHHELKSNQLGSKIKRSRKRTKLISGSVSSVTSSATNPANHEATAANAHSSERKILKQSMFDSSTAGNRQHILASKKDKLNAKVNNSNNNKNNLTPTNIEPLSKKFAPSSVAFGDLKSLLTNNNNWFKFDSVDLNDAKKMLNSESLIKPTTSNSPHVVTKKDEVDLHIRELSLLDLHSSEDDSSFDPNKRNGINRMFSSGQIKLISSKSSTNTNTNTNANSNEKTSIFNEIISKRIKYSTPTPTSSLADSSSSSQPCTSSLSLSTTASHISTCSSTQLLPTSAALSTATDEETNKLDDFIEYLSKSLDSTAHATNAVTISDNNHSQASSSNTNTISSTRFNAKKQSNSCISTSDLILSPPSPSNISKSQIKRKKKDNQNNNYPLVLISVESSAAAAGGSNESPATNLERKNAPDTNTHSSITPGESEFSRSIENDTLQHMKNLDINNDLNAPKLNTLLGDLATGRKHEKMARQVAQDQAESNIFSNSGSANFLGGNSNKIELPNKLNLNLNDVNSRNYLWNLLKSHTPVDELIHHFGASLHDKISFWDLVQLKLKFSQNNHLKTTYEIIDDYTVLYSNMSALLERYVNEQSSLNSRSMSSKKSTENSSRSRSSSRNFRKQSTSK